MRTPPSLPWWAGVRCSSMSQALLEKNFDGSLPAFLATFLQDRKLTKEEAAELERMIEEATK